VDIEDLKKVGLILWDTKHVWMPLLVVLISKYIPQGDKFLRSTYNTLDEIEAVTQATLKHYPDLSEVNTFDDIITDVKGTLGKKYGKLDDTKIKNTVQNTIKKEGWDIDWTQEGGKIMYNHKF
jgi:hypothetical protein